MKRSLVLIFCLLSFFLVACQTTPPDTPTLPNANPTSGDVGTPASGLQPTLLHVTRTDLSPTNSMGPLNKTVSDAVTVQKLYTAAQALPAYAVEPSISQNCLNDTGVMYHLEFLAGSTEVGRMNLDPGSCMVLYLSQTNLRQADQNFLSLFKQSIQVDPLTH